MNINFIYFFLNLPVMPASFFLQNMKGLASRYGLRHNLVYRQSNLAPNLAKLAPNLAKEGKTPDSTFFFFFENLQYTRLSQIALVLTLGEPQVEILKSQHYSHFT